MASFIYRRSLNQTEWHFCATCSDWPLIDFEQQPGVPEKGTICGECKARSTRGICNSTQVTELPVSKNSPVAET